MKYIAAVLALAGSAAAFAPSPSQKVRGTMNLLILHLPYEIIVLFRLVCFLLAIRRLGSLACSKR